MDNRRSLLHNWKCTTMQNILFTIFIIQVWAFSHNMSFLLTIEAYARHSRPHVWDSKRLRFEKNNAMEKLITSGITLTLLLKICYKWKSLPHRKCPSLRSILLLYIFLMFWPFCDSRWYSLSPWDPKSVRHKLQRSGFVSDMYLRHACRALQK